MNEDEKMVTKKLSAVYEYGTVACHKRTERNPNFSSS